MDSEQLERVTKVFRSIRLPDGDTIGETVSWLLHSEGIANVNDRENHRAALEAELRKMAQAIIDAL